jgi:mono/diheme cytochrome c family protein
MRLRQIIFGIIAVFILAILGAFAWTWRSEIAPIKVAATSTADKQAVQHGAELAAIGNCADCHTTGSGASYAGGRPIPTPFGTIFSTNITPDPETGIGKWSEAAFARAMHDGVDREGRQLYPAFPYDHFTKATSEDIHALYAFLMSKPPVHNVVPANELGFPFNIRPIVAGWKILFLRQASLEPDSSKSPEWNRGRYLVEGHGHCGSCHTPRNALGAEKKNSAYAGGAAEGWDAPPLNSSLMKAHQWTTDQLAEYLSTGWHRLHGAAAGPMADVAKNLGQASSQDVHAIATYIASLAPQPGSTAAPAVAIHDKPVKDASAEVVAIYNGACAKCHNDRSGVGPSKAIPLSLSTSLRQAGSANTVRVILDGIQSYRNEGGPYMPAFDGILTDKQIASVAEYVRARYTDQPQWTDAQQEIAKARQGGS